MNETIHPQPSPDRATQAPLPQPRSLFLSGASEPSETLLSLVERAFGADAPPLQPISLPSDAFGDAETPALLLQVDPSDQEASAALEARNADGLPLWAVVANSSELQRPHDADSIGADELDTAAAATLLRLTLRQHSTQRALEQACGDLGSIASRARHDMRSYLGVLQTSTYLLSQPAMQGEGHHAEILQTCRNALRKQALLIDVLAACAETSEPDPYIESITMDAAFFAARQRCAQDLEASAATLAESPERMPDAAGVKPWVELIWTLYLSSALARAETSSVCRAGARPDRDGGAEYFIRFEMREGEDARALTSSVPFHRLHLERANRDLALPVAQRLALAQGGYAGARQLEGQSVEYYFSLPAAKGAAE